MGLQECLPSPRARHTVRAPALPADYERLRYYVKNRSGNRAARRAEVPASTSTTDVHGYEILTVALADGLGGSVLAGGPACCL